MSKLCVYLIQVSQEEICISYSLVETILISDGIAHAVNMWPEAAVTGQVNIFKFERHIITHFPIFVGLANFAFNGCL